jgi:L-alanine-DL-glutamate epimerase-like enolase superfamily enzyme
MLKLFVSLEKWPLLNPFRITGYVWESIEVVVVGLEEEGRLGQGEAAGVYYRNDRPEQVVKTLESWRDLIEGGIDRLRLQTLPPGGARNALDCALWDLEAKRTGCPVWKLAQLPEPPGPLLTTFTCGADTPERMSDVARRYTGARALKLKLTGDATDAERVIAVRAARPTVWLGVDANQGFTPHSLERLMPTLVQAGVSLIEQPFPIGHESLLDGFQSPIPIAADESLQTLADVPQLAGRFNVLNIKLDKCGGLTEALAIVKAARDLGLSTMVGNMLGTSLAMAPAFLVGQLCAVTDLDGPVFLKADRPQGLKYEDGFVDCPESLWGAVTHS